MVLNGGRSMNVEKPGQAQCMPRSLLARTMTFELFKLPISGLGVGVGSGGGPLIMATSRVAVFVMMLEDEPREYELCSLSWLSEYDLCSLSRLLEVDTRWV